MSETILRVALPVPLRQLFDYLPPAAMDTDSMPQLRPGLRLEVPFGRRKQIGILVACAEQSDVPRAKLRRVERLLEERPLLSDTMVKLCLWAADYYHYPPGQVLPLALPPQLRRSAPQPRQSFCQPTADAPTDLEQLSPRQRALLQLLRQAGRPLSLKSLREAGISDSVRRTAERKGWVETLRLATAEIQPEPDLPSIARAAAAATLPTLNSEQSAAVERIGKELGKFAPILLEGVTGSGKTEVYLRLIEQVLASGKQALVLVPEIALTRQTVQRFTERFGIAPTVLHSGLSEKLRREHFLAAARGYSPLVIGTRSAIFTSLATPGLLVVDEEHDPSFKQQDRLRYSARDLAVVRGRLEGIPVILGSATPSLESRHNADQSRYQQLQLRSRVGGGSPPKPELLDIRGQELLGGLAPQLLAAIDRELSAGKQALLFLNRRGYTPLWQCGHCGWAIPCPNCDSKLTFHSNPRRLLMCHHCGFQQPPAQHCPQCKQPRMSGQGLGTQRCEAVLREQFPGIPIHRMDRDRIRDASDFERIFNAMQSGEPCLLLGTQMIAKGHHFPAISLAAVLEADSGLFSPDFRASERLAQLLIQVSGRAGRGGPGQVWLQTAMPEHPLYTALLRQDYPTLCRELLQERQQRRLPPYSHLALIRFSANRDDFAREQLAAVATRLKSKATGRGGLQLTGPLPAPLARREGKARYYLSLQSANRSTLHRRLNELCRWLDRQQFPADCHWTVDVDPQEL